MYSQHTADGPLSPVLTVSSNAEATLPPKTVITATRSPSPHGGVGVSTSHDHPVNALSQLHRQYVSQSEVEDAIRLAIHVQLENAPFRLINTSTGRLCNQDAQINAFMGSKEYKELSHSSVIHVPVQTRPIKEAVVQYFEGHVIAQMGNPGANALLAMRGIVGRGAIRAASTGSTLSSSMFQTTPCSSGITAQRSALTIVYLSDVPSSKSGALANSAWNTRAWSIPELLAPKEPVSIMEELEHSTGINAQALLAFRPGTRDAREKLQWASMRVTARDEDPVWNIRHLHSYNLRRRKTLQQLPPSQHFLIQDSAMHPCSFIHAIGMISRTLQTSRRA
ncbi:uncharacterized protein F5147DRAFT_841983 [Suillus discolor]|uniref:Uncharacterized protein n=1 Tax=Suillus discolor TaxID=1912936 RepID=A0A9P7JKS1_9AGAM|nr:uncharacterized protein F5147DRAFT_841983 [Suillus discolor]KAG2084068.1 hypothetical protein F5147DRAFT_841983 [Suillus discolor]